MRGLHLIRLVAVLTHAVPVLHVPEHAEGALVNAARLPQQSNFSVARTHLASTLRTTHGHYHNGLNKLTYI